MENVRFVLWGCFHIQEILKGALAKEPVKTTHNNYKTNKRHDLSSKRGFTTVKPVRKVLLQFPVRGMSKNVSTRRLCGYGETKLMKLQPAARMQTHRRALSFHSPEQREGTRAHGFLRWF